MNMLNRYDILKSRIISISMLIFICSIIICSLSVLLGHQDCSDWDAIDEDCWRNDSFHNLYKIGFILGVITFLPALYKIFPKFWESMKPFCEKILEYSILICVVLVPITIIIMFLYPNCYGDEVDYNELCTEGSLEYSLSIFIAFCYLFLFIVLVIRSLIWIRNIVLDVDDNGFQGQYDFTPLVDLQSLKPENYVSEWEKRKKRERMEKIIRKKEEYEKFSEWEQRAIDKLRNPHVECDSLRGTPIFLTSVMHQEFQIHNVFGIPVLMHDARQKYGHFNLIK